MVQKTKPLVALMLLSSAAAVKLGSSTPSAEIALAEIEANVVGGNKRCLCFQYEERGATPTINGLGGQTLNPSVPGNAGALTLPDATDGTCKSQTLPMDTAGLYAWESGFDSTALFGDVGAVHLNVPVTNESCLYNLWMCACWANQADGCLCAFELPDYAGVEIRKPKMGSCGPGAGKVTDTTAAGDYEGHAIHGFGGLALKCTPNPCQACCKGQGKSCACCGTGGGGGAGGKGGGGGGGGCGGKGGGGGSCCGGGGSGGYGGGSGGCGCGGGGDGDGCCGTCEDCCGKGPKCGCPEFAGCENSFLQCPDAGCCCC